MKKHIHYATRISQAMYIYYTNAQLLLPQYISDPKRDMRDVCPGCQHTAMLRIEDAIDGEYFQIA